MEKESLEERARKLLKYHMTKKGPVPNPSSPEFREELQYLFENDYITKNYKITFGGKAFINED